MFRLTRIHTTPIEKGSTWLQLFFDLVYVAILIEIGNQFAHSLDLQGAVKFIFLFIPIWWSWLEFVEYGSRYPVDDIGMRVLTVIYMAIMLLLAFEIHRLGDGANMTVFIFTYALSKFILAIMYGRAWFYYPTYRQLTSHQAIVFSAVGIVWLILAFATPTALWIWTIPILIGTLSPLIIRLIQKGLDRAKLVGPPIKYHFISHRFGELTIIVLGEFFIKLVTSSAGRELTAVNYMIGAFLLTISVSLWWLYFDHLEHIHLSSKKSHIALWTYSHFPFLVAITIYGVVGNKLFAATPFEPISDTKRILFMAALATAVLAYGAIEWASKEKDEPLSRTAQPMVRIGAAGALLAIGFWGSSLNVGWLTGLAAAILLAQVAFDVYARIQQPDVDKLIAIS